MLPFYTAVAAAEDELNHHAGVHIVYGTVSFRVNTHDAGNAVTELDVALAVKIAAIASDQGV